MSTDWSLATLARLQVPGLVIIDDDGAGTVYSLHCTQTLLHPGPGIYVFTAGVAIMTIMTRTRVLQYRN